MAACRAELCRNWTGMGCICEVLDIEPDVVCGSHPDFPGDDCPLCPDENGEA